MKWNTIREKYPNRIVLIEAINAYSKDNRRIIEDMAVVDDYDTSKQAWEGYKNLHRISPERELYIFHTINEDIQVEEQAFIGVRGRK